MYVCVLVYVRLLGYADFEAQRLESGLMVLGDPRLTGISNCIGADGQIDYVNGLCDASLSTAKEVRTRKNLLFWSVRVQSIYSHPSHGHTDAEDTSVARIL